MILEEETYKKFGYYPSELSLHSGKWILAACDGCGTIRERRKNDYHSLCRSCSEKGERHWNWRRSPSEETRQKMSIVKRGEKHPNWKEGEIIHVCLICGKAFHIKPYRIKKGGGKFCSRKCSGIAQSVINVGAKNPAWKGGKVKLICKQCGQFFEAKRSHAESGRAKYCSHSCTIKATRHNTKIKPLKTHPEKIFEDMCDKYNLPFHFVGNGSLWIGNANPDFIHNTRKLCIEIFGDYWHSPLIKGNIPYVHTFEGRRKQLKAEGYKLIVFWEADLMREDAEAFVLHTLKDIK